MNSVQKEQIIFFFNKCKIIVSELPQLHGMLIPREIFLDINLYNSIKEYIPNLKQIFTSSALTGLQSTAEKTQRWPLLNLVRQILKSCNFNLLPKRISAGYTKDGKKIFKRMFIIEKIQSVNNSVNTPNEKKNDYKLSINPTSSETILT